MKVVFALVLGVIAVSGQHQFQRARMPGPSRAVAAPNLSNKFADGTGGLLLGGTQDFSGCGIHRDCYTCMQQGPKCQWMGATGCIPSNGHSLFGSRGGVMNILAVCGTDTTNANVVGQSCPMMSTCQSCTGTSGCIWSRGSCTYSRGDGCLRDPLNCANYPNQCSAISDPALAPATLGGAAPADQSSMYAALLLNGGRGGPDTSLALASLFPGGLNAVSRIPGATMLNDNRFGVLNGLVGPSVNQYASTSNPVAGAGQSVLCLPGDIYCNSAAMDPYAPHNLGPAQRLLDTLGLPNTGVRYAGYNQPGAYAPFNYGADVASYGSGSSFGLFSNNGRNALRGFGSFGWGR